MPDYLRKYNDRDILVLPSKWDKTEEIPPFDCLDITDARKEWEQYLVPRYAPEDKPEHPIARELRRNPSLYRSLPFTKTNKGNPRLSHPLFGCCVVATEVLFFLVPEDRHPICYKAYDEEGIYHWWLECKDSHSEERIIQDATAAQFDDLSFSPPYETGTKTSLMGWKQSPSKRTLDLLTKIAGKSTRYKCFDTSYAPPDPLNNLERFYQS